MDGKWMGNGNWTNHGLTTDGKMMIVDEQMNKFELEDNGRYTWLDRCHGQIKASGHKQLMDTVLDTMDTSHDNEYMDKSWIYYG